MTTPYGRAEQRFSSAVRALALGRGRINERLAEAWMHLATLKPDDVPESVGDDFRRIRERWERATHEGREGTITAAATAMTEDQATDAARQILDMHYEVSATIHG